MAYPTKPGPDADRIAEINADPVKAIAERYEEKLADRIAVLDRELAEITAASKAALLGDVPADINRVRRAAEIVPELARLRNEQPPKWQHERNTLLDSAHDDLDAPSPAPSPEPQDVQGAVASVLRRYGIAKSSAEHVATQVLAALAQSDAQPKRPELRLEEDVQGKRAMLGGYQMPDALIPSLEAAEGQSDAQPVAWRYSYPGYPNQWNLTNQEWVAEERRGNVGCIIEPLYTAPHRPDASGLVEAAELAENRAEAMEQRSRGGLGSMFASQSAEDLRQLAAFLRSRAADRSAPRTEDGK